MGGSRAALTFPGWPGCLPQLPSAGRANGNESLTIVVNGTTSVKVYGHFSPSSPDQENGRMEQIIFANETITSAAELNSLM